VAIIFSVPARAMEFEPLDALCVLSLALALCLFSHSEEDVARCNDARRLWAALLAVQNVPLSYAIVRHWPGPESDLRRLLFGAVLLCDALALVWLWAERRPLKMDRAQRVCHSCEATRTLTEFCRLALGALPLAPSPFEDCAHCRAYPELRAQAHRAELALLSGADDEALLSTQQTRLAWLRRRLAAPLENGE